MGSFVGGFKCLQARRHGVFFFPQEFPFVRGLVCMCTDLDSMSVVCVKTAECDNEDVIRVRMSRERLMNTGFGIGGMARGAY